MVFVSSKVPLAILIFDYEGTITYRAYSPTLCSDTIETEYNTQHDEEELDTFGQFLAKVYNKILYNLSDPLNNSTRYGRLLEIHTRDVHTPITEDCDMIYFSVYNHPNCNYRPVRRGAPILFHSLSSQNYAETHPEIVQVSAIHEYV